MAASTSESDSEIGSGVLMENFYNPFPFVPVDCRDTGSALAVRPDLKLCISRRWPSS